MFSLADSSLWRRRPRASTAVLVLLLCEIALFIVASIYALTQHPVIFVALLESLIIEAGLVGSVLGCVLLPQGWVVSFLAIVAGILLGALIVSVVFYVLLVSVPPYILDAVVYASLFGLMGIGLTLTYLTTKVPNFAYGSFVTVGIYTSFTLLRVNHMNPYLSTPIAFLLGAGTSVVMYLGILRMLARRGSSLVALMIATLAIDIAFVGIFGIYSDYLTSLYGIIDSKYFIALSATPGTDFSLLGLPGLLFVAPGSLGGITIGLFLLLTRTRFGIAMRASVENPSLARVLGIDVEQSYTVAWFLAGGFAALAGSYYSLWLPGGTTAGSNLIVEIFAASVLGGLASIYGAAIGGLIIGASEILLTQAGVQLLGAWVQIYQKGVPLVIMVVTLLLFPKGLVSIQWTQIPDRSVRKVKGAARRVSRILALAPRSSRAGLQRLGRALLKGRGK